MTILGSSLSGNTKLEPAYFASILPGALLTALIVARFWPVFSGPRSSHAQVLLVLDCFRWINSFLMVLLRSSVFGEQLLCIFALIGLTMPTIFAVVALTMSQALDHADKYS
jgi:hypothetical protein